MRKQLAAAGLGLALALGGIAVAPAADAATTAGCTGASCYGKDPDAMGCGGDAYTAASVNTAHGLVEIRYSPVCKANWARISNAPAGTWFWVQNSNGQEQQFYLPSGYTSGWTYMVDGTVKARAGNGDAYTVWV
ncbi:DUF2690 domain-containing protein [Streptomyces sp. SID2888]|uniref:DUF2690 domain-containing protein n=1 Tax=Streptomyces TaxID=1883 RepID=UPI00136F80AA|nr:DUF2690 domain-containing protein [Streptomyces sp. SID2888]MYV44241.1 DUF2690 domain-containing protein [Streptomyces sp. SID2888]